MYVIFHIFTNRNIILYEYTPSLTICVAPGQLRSFQSFAILEVGTPVEHHITCQSEQDVIKHGKLYLYTYEFWMIIKNTS